MKAINHFRILFILGMAGLFLLSAALPANAATGTISLSVNEGPADTVTRISGSGFTPSDNYTVNFGTGLIAAGAVSAGGDFFNDLVIPRRPRGNYQVTVNTTSDTSNIIIFSITPEITLDSTSGRSGGQVKISGTGFKASSSITVYFETTSAGTTTTDVTGSFNNAAITIPVLSEGQYEVTAKDSAGVCPGIIFDIKQPKITLSKNSAHVNEQVTVSGSGFKASSSITILFDNASAGTALTDAGGAFNGVIINTPAGTTGQHTVTAKDSIGASQGVIFSIEQAEISLGADSGYAGDRLTVTGFGFKPGSNVAVLFDNLTIGNINTDAGGAFTNAAVTVPASARGPHSVTAKDSNGASQGVFFNVKQRSALAVPSGSTGETVEISGSGFESNSRIMISFDNMPLATDTTTAANGEFSAVIEIPELSAGAHTIEIKDAGNNTDTAIFNITPRITISPAGGPAKTITNLTGTGFSAGAAVTVKFNGTAVATNPGEIITNSSGSFSAGFEIPACLPGTYTVEAADPAYSANVKFDAMLAATISQSTSEIAPGHVGMQLAVSGVGFMPNAKVIVTRATIQEELAAVKTDANGVFLIDFIMPPSPGGKHTIIVTDGVNTKEFEFFIEQQAPPVPTIIKPDTDVKAPEPVLFDWKDVTDESGVTYTIQIARDELFSTIILEEDGLPQSEFKLPEGELKSTTQDHPYFWRIKGVDGAFNEGEWSEIRAFSLGFTLTLPNGESELTLSALTVYGSIVFLVLLVLAGIWVGRKSVRY